MNYSQYCYAQSIFSIVFSVFCEHSQNTANNRISNKANVLLLIGFKFSGTRNGAFTQLSQKRKKKGADAQHSTNLYLHVREVV